jgi:hypothetical protein
MVESLMASLDTLIARDMAAIVADADAPLSRAVVFWDKTNTDLVLDDNAASAGARANVFFKLENRTTDRGGKVQVKVAVLSLPDEIDEEAIDVDEEGWFRIDDDEDHIYKIESANHINGNWTVRVKQQRRVNRSAGTRTHGG